MAAASGSDLPGQPPPYSVDDDVALLQPGDDDSDLQAVGLNKFQPPPNIQPQPYTYHSQPAYYGQPVPSASPYIPQVDPYLHHHHHHHQQQQQQQQQTTVVVTGQIQQPAVMFVPTESFCGKMVLACFVLWCCNPIFGLIAFILAAHADSIKLNDHEGAYRLGRASLWVSVSGVIIGLIVLVVIIAVLVVNVNKQLNH